MLFTFAAALAAHLALGRSEVTAPVPGTALHVALEAPGFRDEPQTRARLLEEAGESGLLAGEIEPARSTLSVVVFKNDPHRTSAQWRDEIARRPKEVEKAGGQRARGRAKTGRTDGDAPRDEAAKAAPAKSEPFQVGAVACRELVLEVAAEAGGEPRVNTRFDAYFVSAGFLFDLHVSTWTDSEGTGLPRRAFEKIVESFQVVAVRHGKPGDLTRVARDAMHRSLAAWPDWQGPLSGLISRKPDDPSLQFVLGEMLLFSSAPPEEVREAHGKALAALEKLRSPAAELRFARMLCEQSVGLSLLDGDDAAAAIPHLETSLELSRQLRSPARATCLYGLACAQARAGDPQVAIRCLDEAITAEPKLRDVARREPAFQGISGDKRYQALVRR